MAQGRIALPAYQSLPCAFSASRADNAERACLMNFELSIVFSSHRPWRSFDCVASPSTGGQFLQLIGEDPATHVEQLAPEKFFRDLRPGNEDREDQVAALQKAMTGELKSLEGFRVGEIQIKIFVLGKGDSGVCGL